jgi:hypothetical protein
MPNINNLKKGKKTQFKPGQSGNPKGRPKLPNLKEAIAKVLAEEKDGKSALEKILKALEAKAAKGDVRAAQELFDRGYGKAQQFIDHTSDGEKINIPIINWVNGIDKDKDK